MKKQKKDKTYIDFFNRNINFYLQHMQGLHKHNKNYTTEITNTDTGAAKKPTELPPQPINQTSSNALF